jgi:futalosine hydrolase
LLIAATPFEGQGVREALEGLKELDVPLGQLYQGRYGQIRVFLAHPGVGKVNTAAGLALALELTKARAVLQFGIGGAFPESRLNVGDLAIAASETHLDSGVRDELGWHDMETLGFPLLERGRRYYNAFPTDAGLTGALERIVRAPKGPFGTSETVTGTLAEARALARRHGVLVESMEGAAAAQVCTALDVPFAELRAVSNPVGERDKALWDIPLALNRVNRAVLGFLERCPTPRDGV